MYCLDMRGSYKPLQGNNGLFLVTKYKYKPHVFYSNNWIFLYFKIGDNMFKNLTFIV